MRKYRILEVVKRGEAKYYPQELSYFLWFKYWCYYLNEFLDGDLYFLSEKGARDFLDSKDKLKINYKRVIDL